MFSVQPKQRFMDYAEADTSQLGLNLEKANLSPKRVSPVKLLGLNMNMTRNTQANANTVGTPIRKVNALLMDTDAHTVAKSTILNRYA